MKSNKRIFVVDALRGFALLMIVLIHFVEHFDFFREPVYHFFFSPVTDAKVMNAVFFLISGKAYSIFALLFGFSFFIQMSRKEETGIDFRWRFLWRLTILFIIGFLHSLIYKGDILHIYAILGVILIILYKVPTRYLYLIAILLAIQIPLVINLIRSFIQPGYEFVQSFGSQYWLESNNTFANGSFADVVSFNFWKGRANVYGWMFYNGRYLQLIALFIAGFILGRKKIFEEIEKYHRSIKKILIISLFILTGLYGLNTFLAGLPFSGTQKELLRIIVGSYINLAFTSVIMTTVLILYLRFRENFAFSLFSAYGRMSLSNYVFQAVMGVIFFYGFGLGLFRYMGSAWSLLLGMIFFTLQALVSRWWINNFYYGPLEWVWRVLTFFNFKIRFKKEKEFQLKEETGKMSA